jgi:long-chain fatty acid transport protein
MTSWLLLAQSALAGGYYYSDAGIVALGRGGAWIAGADTQFAQYHNPAGLVRIDAPVLNVGLSEVQQKVEFDRVLDDDPNTPETESGFHPTAANQASPYEVPEFGFATPIGDRFAFAFGFTSPYAPSSLFDEDGAQRYSVIDTEIYQFQVGPSLAWRPVEWFAIGASFQWQYLGIGETIKLTTSGIDDPAGDLKVGIQAADLFTPGANVGILLDPVPAVSIGLSLQPPTKFHAKGTGELDFTGNGLEVLLAEEVYTDDEVFLDIELPWVLRGGVAVRPVPDLEIEAAVVWQDWSALGDLRVEEVDVELRADNELIELPPVPREFQLPAGLDDTTAFRLGAEYRVAPELDVRIGGFWEDASLPAQDMSVALYDASKWQLGGGGSVYLLDQRLRFDAAFAWIQFASLATRDSTVTQINALDGPVLVVGNGDYRSHGWIAGASASWYFRQVKKPRPDGMRR